MQRNAGDLVISAVTAVEAAVVIEAKQGPAARADLELLLSVLGVNVVSVDETESSQAGAAWRRFGKGRHPAGLSFGDCFAYAVARVEGAALLYKGHDFAQTDITSAL